MKNIPNVIMRIIMYKFHYLKEGRGESGLKILLQDIHTFNFIAQCIHIQIVFTLMGIISFPLGYCSCLLHYNQCALKTGLFLMVLTAKDCQQPCAPQPCLPFLPQGFPAGSCAGSGRASLIPLPAIISFQGNGNVGNF